MPDVEQHRFRFTPLFRQLHRHIPKSSKIALIYMN